jgi:hypothetical protein
LNYTTEANGPGCFTKTPKTMSNTNKLGIWMDHANAHLMEYTSGPIQTDILTSKFTHEEKEQSLHKGEFLMHNKEQHEQSAYYKMLGQKIKGYSEVVLFGPTSAKTELFNVLRADHQFEKIKIDLQQTDKMTEKQQHAFVRNHFSKA